MLNNKNIDTSTNINTASSIGIFDSGIGGLTVASAITTIMPNQPIVYIGDNAHCPWGDKSPLEIINYSINLTEFLLAKSCNIIVIACNTASAVALNAIQQKYPTLRLFNVIDSMIDYLSQLDLRNYTSIGVIATKQTILSGAYEHNINRLTSTTINNVTIKSLATPLLVPLIEDGCKNNKIVQLVLQEYLATIDLPDHSILILGCTHYFIVKEIINNYYMEQNKHIIILDAAMLIANQIKNFLTSNTNSYQIALEDSLPAEHQIYCTSDKPAFNNVAQHLIANMRLTILPCWQFEEKPC